MTGKPKINRNCLLCRELKVKLYKRCDYCDHTFWDCLGTQFNLTAMLAFSILLVLPYLTSLPLIFKTATLVIILCFLVLGYFVNAKTDALYLNEFTLEEKSAEITRMNQELILLNKTLEGKTLALTQANKELKNMDQIKSNFIATVSHEFRTPLTSIKAFSNILLNDVEKISAEESQDFLEIIDQECDRLSRLVENVLDLSKMEAGKIDWHMEELPLGEIIVKGIHSITPLGREKKITIENRMNPVTLPPVRGDRDRLFQVMTNLLNNAYKFTPPWGRIIVRARASGQTVSIHMEDTGPGIPKDQLETIFSKFKQYKNILTDKQCGTGLGLPICREIIEKHGGRIWAENRPGGGMRITFTLPSARREQKTFPLPGKRLPDQKSATAGECRPQKGAL